MSLASLRKDLKSKERSVEDLIRFVSTRHESEPNYSLLLGSGCSISSGIRSGQDLIKVWSKEIYELDTGRDYEPAAAAEYFKSESWYEAKNEYSSLFERRYDLPKQRRLFIEKEVENKNPSIGYAYLLRLIERSYFRTVFTTNFDDLLNQSFYSHSKIRPIVCAHDSSISSVSITSKRPKIIKLHGDYLFDDIKSTLRETESLEANTKNKFIEFAKDYGLIVVGYGANDRSVMDVLTYLLRHDAFLGNGIYWCLREETTISSDLKKFLSQDRVFYVSITGFDELFAEMNAKVGPERQLPYETRLSSDLTEMMAEIQATKNNFRACPFIIDDLKRSEELIKEAAVGNFLRITDEPQGEKRSSVEENIILNRISEKLNKKAIPEALDLVSKFLNEQKQGATPRSVRQAFQMRLFCYKKLGDAKSARESLNEEIDYHEQHEDGYSISAYLNLVDLQDLYSEKIRTIEAAFSKDEYHYQVHAKHGEVLEEAFVESFDPPLIGSVVDAYMQSINVNPHSNNDAHYSLLNFLFEHDKRGEYKDLIATIFNRLSAQDPLSNSLLKVRVDKMLKDGKSLADALSEINAIRSRNHTRDRDMHYYMILLDLYFRKGTDQDLRRALNECPDSHKEDYHYLDFKAKAEIGRFRSIDDAISTREGISRKFPHAKNNQRQLGYLYLYNDDYKKSLVAIKDFMSDPNFSELIIRLNVRQNDKSALALVEKYFPERDGNYFQEWSFTSLCFADFEAVEEQLRHVNEATNFERDILVINYELAMLRQSKKVNLRRIGRILERSTDDITRAACYAIIAGDRGSVQDRNACEKHLKSAFQSDFSDYYRVRNFPVFSEIDFDKLLNRLSVVEVVLPVLEDTALKEGATG